MSSCCLVPFSSAAVISLVGRPPGWGSLLSVAVAFLGCSSLTEARSSSLCREKFQKWCHIYRIQPHICLSHIHKKLWRSKAALIMLPTLWMPMSNFLQNMPHLITILPKMHSIWIQPEVKRIIRGLWLSIRIWNQKIPKQSASQSANKAISLLFKPFAQVLQYLGKRGVPKSRGVVCWPLVSRAYPKNFIVFVADCLNVQGIESFTTEIIAHVGNKVGYCRTLYLDGNTSEKGFYPVSGVNASTIRPFSIIFRYVRYRKTSFVAIQLPYMTHM